MTNGQWWRHRSVSFFTILMTSHIFSIFTSLIGDVSDLSVTNGQCWRHKSVSFFTILMTSHIPIVHNFYWWRHRLIGDKWTMMTSQISFFFHNFDDGDKWTIMTSQISSCFNNFDDVTYTYRSQFWLMTSHTHIGDNDDVIDHFLFFTILISFKIAARGCYKLSTQLLNTSNKVQG